MRAAFIIVGLALIAACDQTAARDEQSGQATAEAELRAANAAYDQALVDGDAARLDRFMTDDFTIIDDDAAIHDKRNQIDFMTKNVDLLEAKGDDIRVKMLGADAALVTGRFVGRYRYEGKESDFTERYTSVWVRQDGGWRVKHEHTSLLPDPNREDTR